MSELVTVHYGRVFRDFRQSAQQMQDTIVTEGGKIVRREVESSIRTRFFDTGRTLQSLREQVVTEGDSKTYQLTPIATSKRGAPYPLFGEYGTGQRGAASGQPAPAGYKYGDSAGMTARRFSRIALTVAKPQVEAMAQQQAKQLRID